METREEIANLIYKRLADSKEVLEKQFVEAKNKIGYFFLDDLLPEELANTIFNKFPGLSLTKKRKNLAEFKHVAYQMDEYDPLLQEVLYAFQDDRIVALITDICAFKDVFADENLYAGGLSLMSEDNFLNPHLDNSHDKDRKRWRVLNLLYYVTPNWDIKYGGNLELWPNGLNNQPVVIQSKFNRLAVMVTHQKSWHSVNKVLVDKVRCCVSNYYFSNEPALVTDKFHVTTFRGRPKERYKNLLLKTDGFLRSSVRKIFKKGIRENPHQYKKK